MPVIDVHTHMLGRGWFEMLRRYGAPHYEIRPSMDVPEAVYCDGAPFLTPQPAHFDYALRIKDMSAAKVDLAIVSLTAPSCYWGGRDISLQTASLVNDEMAEAHARIPAGSGGSRRYRGNIPKSPSTNWRAPASAARSASW